MPVSCVIINASGATANACAAQPNLATGITDAVSVTGSAGDFIALAVDGVFYGKAAPSVAIKNRMAKILAANAAAADKKSIIADAINNLGTVDLSTLAKIEQFRLKRSLQDLTALCEAIGGAALIS